MYNVYVRRKRKYGELHGGWLSLASASILAFCAPIGDPVNNATAFLALAVFVVIAWAITTIFSIVICLAIGDLDSPSEEFNDETQ